MTAGPWHGTKKCAINGAKIPKRNRVAGQPCPFCGNTIGATIGAGAQGEQQPQSSAPTGKSLSDDGTKADDKPIWQRPAVIAAGVAVVLLLLVFAGSSGDGGGSRNGGGGDTPLPTNAAVVSRIRSLTDCAELQREFDIAADNHDIQSAQGDLTMMQVSSEYMEIAYDRAESLGCYG